ncbi:DRP1D [Symbiodinium natans]|uniref:DRP1D protein n=1 Tax=Symbiodinium natans TaxID=878477 RepID=A0A812NKH4_9DINO|nr:DRP1D [Symbiodinium natans]
MTRAVDFFECMALQYMYLDKEDVPRIRNAVTINPDMPFMEDNLQRIFVVGNIKAAKMRDITMYMVQKTAYLMTQGFACAFRNMTKNETERALIDSLAEGTSVENVFDVLRRGFIKHLLVHAHHAYLSSISDHSQFMHQVGSFCRSDVQLCGDSGAWLHDALEKEIGHQLGQLLRHHEAVDKGIKEGLRVLGGLPMQKSLPSRLVQIVNNMQDQGIFDSQDFKLHHLLGMTAVAFAFFAPRFSAAVIMRCMSGLLGSLNSTYYRHSYEESVHKELTKVFIDGDLAERVEVLRQHEAELEVEYNDLCHALEKLRRLR